MEVVGKSLGSRWGVVWKSPRHSRAAAERAGRIGDGFFPGTGDLGELIDIMRQTAADAGRDPSAIEVTAGAAELSRDPGGAVEELESLGVHRMFVPAFLFFRSEDLAEEMTAFTARLH